MDDDTTPHHPRELHELLLPKHEVSLVDSRAAPLSQRRKSFLIPYILFHVCTIIVLVLIWAYLKKELGRDYLYGSHSTSNGGPVLSVVEHETVLMQHDVDNENRFKGPPRPELDKAWDELLQPRLSAVLPSELGNQQSSVAINDGLGHVLVELSVFHDLDCLNSIRKYLDRAYYNESTSKTVAHLRQVNTCIDSIRQSLICHGDIAVDTYIWKQDRILPWPDFNIVHECRKWESILDWTVEHQAPDLSGDMLIHPTFGPAYPGALALKNIPSG